MANALDNGGFWLPSEFLTVNDIFTDKENLNRNGFNTAFGANCGFPIGFPYDFGSYGSSSLLSSPVDSVVSSTETESDEDLLAGLTRLLARSTLQERTQKIAFAPQNLEKSWVLSGSPQSTLSAFGSWSGRSAVSSNGSPNGPSQFPSPPTTPLGGNDSWDLIYAAAGQVARLKMNGEGPPKGRGLLAPPRSLTTVHPSPPMKNPSTGFYSNQCLSHNLSQTNHFERARQDQVLKQQCSSVWGKPTKEGLFSKQNQFQQQLLPQNRGGRVIGSGGFEGNGRYTRPLDLPQCAWPTLQVQHQNHQNQLPQQGSSGMRAVFLGGSGVKKECAGTGVFLPRRYGSPSESRKKPGCSTALLPDRVVQALNKNFDDMTCQGQAQSRLNGAFIPDYETLMARRNAILAQQKRSLRPEGAIMVNHELCLPQEWTY